MPNFVRETLADRVRTVGPCRRLLSPPSVLLLARRYPDAPAYKPLEVLDGRVPLLPRDAPQEALPALVLLEMIDYGLTLPLMQRPSKGVFPYGLRILDSTRAMPQRIR